MCCGCSLRRSLTCCKSGAQCPTAVRPANLHPGPLHVFWPSPYILALSLHFGRLRVLRPSFPYICICSAGTYIEAVAQVKTGAGSGAPALQALVVRRVLDSNQSEWGASTAAALQRLLQVQCGRAGFLSVYNARCRAFSMGP